MSNLLFEQKEFCTIRYKDGFEWLVTDKIKFKISDVVYIRYENCGCLVKLKTKRKLIHLTNNYLTTFNRLKQTFR